MSVLLFPPLKAVSPVQPNNFPNTTPSLQAAVVRATQQLLILNAQAALHACEDCAFDLSRLARVRHPADASTFIADLVALADDSSFRTLTVPMPLRTGLSGRPAATILRFERRPTILH